MYKETRERRHLTILSKNEVSGNVLYRSEQIKRAKGKRNDVKSKRIDQRDKRVDANDSDTFRNLRQT